jgi:von Hippel-Lindau disease tumor supressor
MNSTVRLSIFALSVYCFAVTTSGVALAQRIHAAENVGIRSVNGDISTSVRFVNHRQIMLKIYWLNYEGKRVFYRSLKPGEQYVQQTYLTHPWLITNVNDNALYLFFPDAQLRTVEIK